MRHLRLRLRDMTSFRSGRLIEYVISREEGESSGKKYDTTFTTVLPCILSSIIPNLDLAFKLVKKKEVGEEEEKKKKKKKRRKEEKKKLKKKTHEEERSWRRRKKKKKKKRRS